MNELKSEIRRPKSERNPKIEIRRPKRFRISEWRIFGLRSSDFFRISAFGFRILLGLAFPLSAQTNILYQNDFQQASLGKLPEDFLVLDGAFSVKEENGNKFMELPGAPLDSF